MLTEPVYRENLSEASLSVLIFHFLVKAITNYCEIRRKIKMDHNNSFPFDIVPQPVGSFDGVLPRNIDILSMILFFLEQRKSTKGKLYHQNIKDRYRPIAVNVMNSWEKLKIPIFTEKIVIKKITELHQQYNNIKRYHQMNRKFNFDFVLHFFNIARCQCYFKVGVTCSCPSIDKIPVASKAFYLDQLGPRQIDIEKYLRCFNRIQFIECVQNGPFK